MLLPGPRHTVVVRVYRGVEEGLTEHQIEPEMTPLRNR